MLIRDETSDDEDAIRSVEETAFGRSDEARLVALLRVDGDLILSLVAGEAGKVIGHLALSPMEAPFRALGLAPVAVRPDRQECGVGRRLIERAVERSAATGWEAMFMVGDPAYYRRFGFDADGAGGFASSYAGPHLMVLALTGSLPNRAGTIVYAPAFRGL